MKLLKTIPLFLFIGLSSITLNAQWVEKSSGITGGHVNAFLSDGTNLFAGTINGVYLSINDGISWTAVNAGMTDTRVRSLAISGANLFAATDVGIFLSTNNGTSWIAINNGLTNTNVFALAFSGSNLFAGTAGGGVFLSSNNGATWTATNTGLTNLNIASLAVNGGNVFAGTLFGGGAVFISSNNGVSWTNTGLTGGGIYDLEVSGGNLFAGSFGGGVSLTTDNGVSWTTVNTGLSSLFVGELQATGSNLFAATEAGVFLSTNNGSTWAEVNNGVTQRSATALAVSGGNLVAGTPGGGVFLSNNNGASWAVSNSGLTNAMVAALVSDGSNLFAGAYSGVFFSSNNGTNWTELNVGLTDTRVFALALNGSNLFAGTDGGGVFLSTNNGASWAAVNGGLTNTRIRSLTSIGSNLFAGTFGGGVFVSNNNGTSWSAINTGLSNLTVYTLLSSGGNLFAGTFNGCFLSTNNGASWTAVNTGLTTLQIRSLGVSGSNIFAGTDGGGVFLSTNNGTSWAAVNSGLSVLGRYVYALKVIGSNVIAGTLDRIYVSTDNGSTWASASTGLPNKLILALAENGTNVFSGMEGRNVWSRPLLEIGITSNPTITSFAPTSGPIGTTVNITGTNFTTIPANNIVYFGATRATVTAATANQLTVTVPTGATYEPITVQVSGLTAYSSKPFVVTFAGGGSLDVCSFAPKVDFGAGTNPFPVAVGDFDGDGKVDVAVANRTTKTLLIYLNTSTTGSINTGSLAAPISKAILPGGDPFSVIPADLDGDGKMDLVVTNAQIASISVYRNTSTVGNLSFENSVSYAAGVDPLHAAIGDLDGDGKPEIAITNRFSNSISVYKNTSSTGGFNAGSFSAKVDFATGVEPHRLAISDLDGDGKPEIVATNNISNTISVFRNTTTAGVINAASFAAKIDFATGARPFGVAIADVDGDGKSDIIVANNIGGSISLLQNVSTGTISAGSFAAKVDFTVGPGPIDPEIADLDGDGKLDIVVANFSSNYLSIFKNTALTGTISTSSLAAKVDLNTGAAPAGVSIADIDGDGKPEILAANHNSNAVSLFQNLIGSILSPTITSFNPTFGPIGNSVTITGTNFITPFTSSVEFNGVPATITASSATSLTVTVPVGATTGPIEVTIGCNTVTSTSNFSVTVPGTINISPQPTSTTVCDGTTGTFTVTASGTTNIIYQWQKFNGTIFDDVLNGGGYSGATATAFNINTTGNFGAGDYRCKVSGDLAPDVFSNTVTLTINPLPTQPTIPVQPLPVCGPSAVIPVTASGGTPGQYRWYTVATGGTSITGATNATYSPTVTSSPANFFVSINDGTCESTRTPVSVTLLPVPPKPDITASGPLILCTGGSVTLTPPNGFASYLWSDASTTNQPRVINSTSTLTLRVTNASNCTSVDSDPVTVTVAPCPPTVTTSTLTVTLGASTTLDLTSLITGQATLDLSTLKIKVQPPSGAIASIIPPATLKVDYAGITFSGTETVTIEVCNVVGECASQVFTIQVDGSLTYYNAVSANGDDKNSTFFIQNIDLLPETKNNLVTIYNRWGDVVFEAENYDNVSKVFRGLSNNGDELPSGAYFYKVKFASGKSEKTGFIVLRK